MNNNTVLNVSCVSLRGGIIVSKGTLDPISGHFLSASGEVSCYFNPKKVASVLASERRHRRQENERHFITGE